MAFAAQKYREALDIKMLQKKKQSRELSSLLGTASAPKLASKIAQKSNLMQKARGSIASDGSALHPA